MITTQPVKPGLNELHRQWNVTRAEFYRNPTDETELAMDDALRRYLAEKQRTK